MDPLRLIEIAQDGDFQRVRQLVQEGLPLSPLSSLEEQQKRQRQKRDHPWSSPVERYRSKLVPPDEDEDLEALSWKHRSKAYDLTRSDVTSKRVYHTDDIVEGIRYTDKRPKSIETTTAKSIDEPVITPATAPMDEDEFDSPYHACSTPSSFTLHSSPSVVTPPKAILDQLALDHEAAVEVTLEMFEVGQEEQTSMERMEGAVNQLVEQRSGARKTMEEHDRLMAEARIAVTPEFVEKAKSMALRRTMLSEKETTSPPLLGEAIVGSDEAHSCDVPTVRISVLENKDELEEQCQIDNDNKIAQLEESRNRSITFEDEEEDEAFMLRSSILTTIVEESTPIKVSSPLTIHTKEAEHDSESVSTWKNFRALNVATALATNTVSPEKVPLEPKVTYTRGEFKKRLTPLNKVTIAAALIEYNEILLEQNENRHLSGDKITNDTRLARAIVKHRKKHGFFTDMTPTHESLKNGAAAIIQAEWRKLLAIRLAKRKAKDARNFAAILIQAQWRTHDNRMNYKWHRGSAILLQSKWKSFHCHKQYISMRSSAIMVQSIARMFLCRSNFVRQKTSAQMVQAQWRSYSCQKHYQMMCSSAILVQSLARGHTSRTKYIQLKASALLVQSQWRSHNCQKQFQRLRSSSILMQSIARKNICLANFRKQKVSSTCIQAASRMYGRRSHYLKCKAATIILQSFGRMIRCRMEFTQQKKAATLLQSAMRMHSSSSKFHSFKQSTIKLQSLARMRQCQTKYLESMRAAVTMQASLRQYIFRSYFLQAKKAATELQSYSRMRLCRNEYLKQKSASTTLQAASRRYLSRSKYIECIKSTIVLQSASRAFLGRTLYLKQQQASIALQGVIRMYIARNNFLAQKAAALVVQESFREYMNQKDHATFEAVREVQARWFASRNDHEALMEIKEIPTSRRTSICKRNFMHYLSSSIIQKRWKNYHQQKTSEAALCIQTRWRSYDCKKEYSSKILSAVRLQARTRGFLCKKNLMVKNVAARLLQSSYRAYICKKNYRLAVESTVKIQSKWRSYGYRKEFHRTIISVIQLQTLFRGCLSRKHFADLVSSHAATKLESIARMYLCRKTFVQNKASKTIQATARMYLCRAQLQVLNKSTTVIQTAFRAYICRKDYLYYLDAVKEKEAEEAALVRRSSLLTTVGEDNEADSDEDSEMFMARSSILTTVVEERSSLSFLSPNGLSYESESETEVLPTTIKKERPAIILEDKQYEENNESSVPVPMQPKNDPSVRIARTETVEDRRASQERLMALAAKVAARRASLNRNNRPEPKMIDPWQQKIEQQKKSKPVLLSKRMAELEKLAKQKRVTSSRFNNNEEEKTRELDVNKPLNRYADEIKDFQKNDSVVKKLFDAGDHDNVVEKPIERTSRLSENIKILDQEIHYEDNAINDGDDTSDEDEFDSAVGSESAFAASQDLPKDSDPDTQYLETFLDQNTVASNEESASVEEDYHIQEHNEIASSWKRLSIVDELAEDIYEFDSDSDIDDDETERTGSEMTDDVEVDPFAEARVENKRALRQSNNMEWNIVDDLIDEDGLQYDGALESDDDDEQNEMVLAKIETEQSFWSLTSSLYSVAGIAASMIGIGE